MSELVNVKVSAYKTVRDSVCVCACVSVWVCTKQCVIVCACVQVDGERERKTMWGLKGEGDFLIMPKTSDPQIANVLRALAALTAAAAAGAYDVIKRKREKKSLKRNAKKTNQSWKGETKAWAGCDSVRVVQPSDVTMQRMPPSGDLVFKPVLFISVKVC